MSDDAIRQRLLAMARQNAATMEGGAMVGGYYYKGNDNRWRQNKSSKHGYGFIPGLVDGPRYRNTPPDGYYSSEGRSLHPSPYNLFVKAHMAATINNIMRAHNLPRRTKQVVQEAMRLIGAEWTKQHPNGSGRRLPASWVGQFAPPRGPAKKYKRKPRQGYSMGGFQMQRPVYNVNNMPEGMQL